MNSRITALQLAANKMAEMTHELTIELQLVAFTVAITIVLGSQVPIFEFEIGLLLGYVIDGNTLLPEVY